MESLICNFYLNVAARKIVRADPSLRYTGMLLGRIAWIAGQQRQTQSTDRLVGLVVRASISRAEDPVFESRLRLFFFSGRVIPVTEKLALQRLTARRLAI